MRTSFFRRSAGRVCQNQSKIDPGVVLGLQNPPRRAPKSTPEALEVPNAAREVFLGDLGCEKGSQRGSKNHEKRFKKAYGVDFRVSGGGFGSPRDVQATPGTLKRRPVPPRTPDKPPKRRPSDPTSLDGFERIWKDFYSRQKLGIGKPQSLILNK